MDEIRSYLENIDIVAADYCENLSDCFASIPDIAQPLVRDAKRSFSKIEQLLYSAPAFIDVIRASVPEETIRTVLTDEQKVRLRDGTLKLMTKKDGTLMANLVNPETNKIAQTISLEKVKFSPEMAEAMTNYATQMQMAQIAEQIQTVQVAIEEVRQGQEFDRLATAYSCQQKLLQAMAIKNPQLKATALLYIASDAEDSRNLLMQSQKANVAFILEQPESFWGKIVSGASPEKIDARMKEVRDSLCAVNMASLVEAMAYREMGEPEAALLSLQYYAGYIKQTYLEAPGLVDRLDMIDPSPEKYWSRILPDIEHRIQALPCNSVKPMIGGNEYGIGTKEM